MLKVACPKCGIKLSAPPEYAGRKVSCQQCKTQFVLPDATKPDPPPAVKTAQATPAPVATTPQSLPQEQAVPQPAPAFTPMPAPTGQPATASPNINVGGDQRFSQPAEENPYSNQPAAQAQLGAIADKAAKPQFSQSLAGNLIESRSLKTLFDFGLRFHVAPTIVRISWMLCVIGACIAVCAAIVILVWSFMQAGTDGLSPSGILLILTFPGLILLYTFFLLLMMRVSHEMVILWFNIAGTLKSIDQKLDR